MEVWFQGRTLDDDEQVVVTMTRLEARSLLGLAADRCRDYRKEKGSESWQHKKSMTHAKNVVQAELEHAAHVLDEALALLERAPNGGCGFPLMYDERTTLALNEAYNKY